MNIKVHVQEPMSYENFSAKMVIHGTTGRFMKYLIFVSDAKDAKRNALPVSILQRSSQNSCSTGMIDMEYHLSLIHISEPTRRTPISYAVFCLKKKKPLT